MPRQLILAQEGLPYSEVNVLLISCKKTTMTDMSSIPRMAASNRYLVLTPICTSLAFHKSNKLKEEDSLLWASIERLGVNFT